LTQRGLLPKLRLMAAFICRFVLSVCCLVLVLPAGWCRFVVGPAVSAKQEASKKAPGGCCDVCRCKEREKPRPEPKHPTAPSRCCCYELDWLKPNPPEKPVVDLSLMALPWPVDSASACSLLWYDPIRSIRGASPPLRLLKCVWLC
jgi:hypothetical protein